MKKELEMGAKIKKQEDKLSINIDGYIYEVIMVEPNSRHLKNGDYQGWIDYEIGVIYISNSLQKKRLEEVLVHEVTHAFLNRYKHQYKKYDEEDVCHMFELFSYKVVSITEYLMSKIIILMIEELENE